MANDKNNQAFVDDLWQGKDLQRFRAMRKVTITKGKARLTNILKDKVPVRRCKSTTLLKVASFSPSLGQQLTDRAVPIPGTPQPKKYSSVAHLFGTLRQRQLFDCNEDGLSEYERCDKAQRKFFS